jgi:hypothetical protein
LLGRIAGCALFHGENIPANWSAAFNKAVFGYPIVPDDLGSMDPELYTGRVVYIRDGVYLSRDGMELSELELTFEADFNCEEYTEREVAALGPVELKPGGKDIAVTEANKAEYLQLFVAHRLVGEVQPQVDAFRAGLAVFFTDEVLASVHACCTPADMQLLLCGVAEIDVDDWEQSAEYRGGIAATTPLVKWFWSAIRSLHPANLAKVRLFCRGASRGWVAKLSAQSYPVRLFVSLAEPAAAL